MKRPILLALCMLFASALACFGCIPTMKMLYPETIFVQPLEVYPVGQVVDLAFNYGYPDEPITAIIGASKATLTLDTSAIGGAVQTGSTHFITGTPAQLITMFKTLTYMTTYAAPDSDQIFVNIKGGSGGADTNKTIDVVIYVKEYLNISPVHTMPSTQYIFPEYSFTYGAPLDAIVVNDIDARKAPIETTISVGIGQIGFSTTVIDNLIVEGQEIDTKLYRDRTITLRGSQTSINMVLSILTYFPPSLDFTEDTLTITTSDKGYFGQGGERSDTDTLLIKALGGDYTSNAYMYYPPESETEENTETPLGYVIMPQEDNDTLFWLFLTLNRGCFNTDSLWSRLGLLAPKTLAFFGNAELLNQLLSTLYFVPCDLQAGDQATLTYKVFSALNNASEEQGTTTFTIFKQVINTPPINTVPSAQSVNATGPIEFARANGKNFATRDSDADNASLTVTISTENGTLEFSSDKMLSIPTAPENTAFTITAPQDEINEALSYMVYRPNASATEDTITMVTSDNGFSGVGGTLTDIDTVSITLISDTNDAPYLSVTGSLYTPINSTVGLYVSAGDADAGNGLLDIFLSASYGVLTVNPIGDAVVSGNGTNSLSIRANLGDLNATLGSISYTNQQYIDKDIINISLDDNGNSGGSVKATSSSIVVLLFVPDAPPPASSGSEVVPVAPLPTATHYKP